jgi:hypothetical protein
MTSNREALKERGKNANSLNTRKHEKKESGGM